MENISKNDLQVGDNNENKSLVDLTVDLILDDIYLIGNGRREDTYIAYSNKEDCLIVKNKVGGKLIKGKKIHEFETTRNLSKKYSFFTP